MGEKKVFLQNFHLEICSSSAPVYFYNSTSYRDFLRDFKVSRRFSLVYLRPGINQTKSSWNNKDSLKRSLMYIKYEISPYRILTVAIASRLKFLGFCSGCLLK